MNVGLYAKAISAAASAAATAALTALADNSITPNEWAIIVGAAVAAGGGVYVAGNQLTGWRRYTKAIVGGLVGLLGALAVAWTDGSYVPSQVELMNIILALLAGAGLTGVVPNATQSQDFMPPVGGADG